MGSKQQLYCNWFWWCVAQLDCYGDWSSRQLGMFGYIMAIRMKSFISGGVVVTPGSPVSLLHNRSSVRKLYQRKEY